MNTHPHGPSCGEKPFVFRIIYTHMHMMSHCAAFPCPRQTAELYEDQIRPGATVHPPAALHALNIVGTL